MARKPIQQEALPGADGKLRTPRDRMWAAMLKLTRKQGFFTPADIEHEAHPVSRDAVQEYLRVLTVAELVEKVAEQGRSAGAQFTSSKWRLLVQWHMAPRINAQGKPITQGLGVLAMWRAAKVHKRFKPSDLALAATSGPVVVSLTSARIWCLALARSGHFKCVSLGKGGTESVYVMANDTGPHAPAITRAKVVFDRNTGVLQLTDTEQEVAHALSR